ncbi:hybrid sensor histidine kinase/response regulator, partial [Bacteroides intestinalis]|nr:hybrid sensor histidine kinase/response regulator [Bacteroides intestinalis]
MSAHISTILERKNGELLIGTSGHGIYSLTLGETEPLIKEAQLPVPSFFITYLFEDHNENLWVSTEGKGLYRVDGSGQAHHYFIGKENAWNIVTSICLDEKGNIYASNINKGIFIYNQQKDTFTPISCPILPDLPINTIYAAGQGKIYIGTIGYGIKVYDIHTQKIKESE